jgi:hypothetical protein
MKKKLMFAVLSLGMLFSSGSVDAINVFDLADNSEEPGVTHVLPSHDEPDPGRTGCPPQGC